MVDKLKQVWISILCVTAILIRTWIKIKCGIRILIKMSRIRHIATQSQTKLKAAVILFRENC